MIGLDTNVFVRFLTQDDQEQSSRATKLIERRLSETLPGFVSIATTVETAWVLQYVYGRSRMDLVRTYLRLLSIDVLRFQHEEALMEAIDATERLNIDLEDALIAALGAAAGCSVTVTFDRKAVRLPEFELLQ